MTLTHSDFIFSTVFKLVLPYLLIWMLSLPAGAASPEKSVIQITTASQQPSWDAPWRFDSVRRSSGTGFLISGRRIITNAHVVSWAKQILVRRYQDPRPYSAKVKFIAHDCDLAILEVEDDRFFQGMESLEIGDLPPVRSTVVTYGYPAGGEQISYTRGVVSRIELQSYSHIGNRAYLAAQTDAAINPGNSGGPVIQDDKVVGVAFQGIPGLENTGFFIPTTLVKHLLKDVEDGVYDGFPQVGVRLVPLQNPAFRQALKLPDDDLGARVDHIFDFPKTKELLRRDDVLLKAGGYAVASDGTILYAGNRVFVGVVFNDFQKGETVPLSLWREGKTITVNLPLDIYQGDRTEGNQYDVLPRYFVFGGLVFTPLNRDFMRTLAGGWTDTPNNELFYELFYRKHESPLTIRKEPVVLASILAHGVNANLETRGRTLIDRVNGIKIEQMEDLVRAFNQGTNSAQHVLEFYPDRNLECLDRVATEAANPSILKTYGISKDRRL